MPAQAHSFVRHLLSYYYMPSTADTKMRLSLPAPPSAQFPCLQLSPPPAWDSPASLSQPLMVTGCAPSPSAGSSVPTRNYCKELSSRAPHARPALIIFPWGGVPEEGHRTPRPRRGLLCLGVGDPLSEVMSRRWSGVGSWSPLSCAQSSVWAWAGSTRTFRRCGLRWTRSGWR